MRKIAILAVSASVLALAACGDSGKSDGAGAAPAAAAAPSTADCKDIGSAMGYVDARQKALLADVKANKEGVGAKFNAFLATVQAEADKAKASNDWVGYCKAIDAALTSAGY